MSSEDQRSHWDLKYQQGLPSLTEPDPFFIAACEKFVVPSFPEGGAALDLAGGLGRHSLWLAGRAWQVTVLDVSAVAIRKIARSALDLNVELEVFVGDAGAYKFQPARFDLIVLFYHLDRSLFPKIVSALKPCGLFMSKMRERWNPDPISATAVTDPLQRGELPSLVPELQVLYHEERPVRDRGVVEFVGRRK